MLTVPNVLSKIVNKFGNCVDPWLKFFQQFSQAPSPALDVILTVSPFEYTAVEPGNIYIDGAVTTVTLTRKNKVIDVGANILIPVCIGDVITITYAVLPVVSFFPNYATPRN